MQLIVSSVTVCSIERYNQGGGVFGRSSNKAYCDTKSKINIRHQRLGSGNSQTRCQ
jgi:hypothetical protein